VGKKEVLAKTSGRPWEGSRAVPCST